MNDSQAPGGFQLDAPRRVLDQSGLNNNAQAAINLANELDRPADPQAVTAAMTPLQLTGAQLSQVMVVAQPLLDLRGEYLTLVATSLAGRTFDDGDVYRACAAAVKTVMWNVDREAG